MTAYLVRRIVAAMPVAFIVGVVAFFLIQLSPGDPAAFYTSSDATPEEILRVRERLGLDRPVTDRFIDWLSHVARGDLGISFFHRIPVSAVIIDALPVTLWLTALSLILATILGVTVGVLTAMRPGGYLDKAATLFVFAGISMPNFWLGMLLVLFLSIGLGIFPAQAFDTTSLTGIIYSLTLPTIALGYAQAAIIARMTRSSMLDVLDKDYVTTAKSKGLRARVVLSKHVLLNAFNPVLTVIGLGVAGLISGSVVVETVFNLPGLGRLTVDSVVRRDYPMVQGILLFAALLVLGVNLATDMLYGVLDPRVRFDRRAKK